MLTISFPEEGGLVTMSVSNFLESYFDGGRGYVDDLSSNNGKIVLSP